MKTTGLNVGCSFSSGLGAIVEGGIRVNKSFSGCNCEIGGCRGIGILSVILVCSGRFRSR
jgi:hypothetical protein